MVDAVRHDGNPGSVSMRVPGHLVAGGLARSDQGIGEPAGQRRPAAEETGLNAEVQLGVAEERGIVQRHHVLRASPDGRDQRQRVVRRVDDVRGDGTNCQRQSGLLPGQPQRWALRPVGHDVDPFWSYRSSEPFPVAGLRGDVGVDAEAGQPCYELVDVAAHSTAVGRQRGGVAENFQHEPASGSKPQRVAADSDIESGDATLESASRC